MNFYCPESTLSCLVNHTDCTSCINTTNLPVQHCLTFLSDFKEMAG